MSVHAFAFQAALVYEALPELDFRVLLQTLNRALASSDETALSMQAQSTRHFALFSNETLHATVALHDTPLSAADMETAVAGADHPETLRPGLGQASSHVVITVRSGPDPLAFDPPAKVPGATLAMVMQMLLRATHLAQPCVITHLCATDRMLTAQEMDAIGLAFDPGLFLRPERLPDAIGPEGESGQCYVFHGSDALIDRLLVLSGIPPQVPLTMCETLVGTLICQYLNGAALLRDGDRFEGAMGLSLYLRHVKTRDGRDATLVSFWPEAESVSPQVPHFTGHAGYNVARAPVMPEPVDTWSAPASGAYTSSRTTEKRGMTSALALIGLGLFLWIGLPMMDIPQQVIKSAFSNDLGTVPSQD